MLLESIGKINIWVSNDQIDRDLFESVIKPEYLVKSMCLVVVDLSRPWEIMDSLKKWTNFIYDAFSNLLLKFPYDKQQDLRKQGKTKLFIYFSF